MRNFGNRAADTITAFVGSWIFVFLHLLWFGGWIGFQVEPFPYGLLTMQVSLEAIFLSTFVMMSQNRQSAKDREKAELDLAIDTKAEKYIETMMGHLDRQDHVMLAQGAMILKIVRHLQVEIEEAN